MDKIEHIVKKYMLKEDDNKTDEIKIYYSDLDLNARKRVLDALNTANEYIDIFTTNGAIEKIEKTLASKPLLIIKGKELIRIMNINF